jgi:hypothetical protein
METQSWEDLLAHQLWQAHHEIQKHSDFKREHAPASFYDREQLLTAWMQSQAPRSSWKRFLCLVLPHRWGQSWNHPCVDCGAPHPKEPMQ